MASCSPCNELLNRLRCCCRGDEDGQMTGESSTEDRSVTPKNKKFRKIKNWLKNGKKKDDSASEEHDGCLEEIMITSESSTKGQCKESCLPFDKNLKLHRLGAAGQQLISREDRLFALRRDGVGSRRNLVEEEENEEENLNKDFEDFMLEIWSVLENSLNVETQEEEEVLKQAILAIQQEQDQDKKWEGFKDTERPPWRPRCCRHKHDSLLKKMVNQRMEEAQIDSNSSMNSSVQMEIIAKGKQLRKDLLTVAKHVRSCYPGENVCQLYANLYHEAFSAKLNEITDYTLLNKDCQHVLLWVNQHYPSIFREEELTAVIEYDQLEALLPDSTLQLLEEQFLIYKENELQTWTKNALISEEQCNPSLRDECYFSPLAIDVTECIHGALTSVEMVLGSKAKTQKIMHCIKDFLLRYKQFLEECIRNNNMNTEAVVKANLPCIGQFRDYIQNKGHFPEHVKTECLSLLTSIKDICHGYFTRPVHKDLKKKYSKLGTAEWLKHNEHVCHDLLDGLERHIEKIKNLEKTCLKELVGHLHEEVLVEYVRKMMRKKTKLKDEKKQHHAAKALCENSEKIHNFFTKNGSDMDWLKCILPDLAELLTIKDTQFIQLQLVTLSRTYPDLSEAHVSAWLYLRANLSASDIKTIKKTFSDFQEPECLESTADNKEHAHFHSSKTFFSKVAIK